MKRKYYIYSLILAAAITASVSCVKEDTGFGKNDLSIRLQSGLTSYSTSKAIEKYDYYTDAELPVSIIRWDEGDVVTHAGKTFLDAVMGRPDPTDKWIRDIRFLDNQFYVDRNSEVGFKGLFPRITDPAWKVNPDGTLEYLIDGETDVMVSEGRKGSYDEGVPVLPFCHGLCHFRIYAYATDESSKEHWGGITSVKLLNLPDTLHVGFEPDAVGEGHPVFTYSEQTEGHVPAELLENGASVNVGMSFDTKTLLGEMLAGAPVKGYLGISVASEKYDLSDGDLLGNSVSIARNFKPGYTYNIILRFSEHGKINASITVEAWQFDGVTYETEQDTDIYTDLSYNGTANCYIVSTANLGYCFNATVKGNGINSITSYDGKTFTLPESDVTLDVDSVAILGQYAFMKYNTATGQYDIVANIEDQRQADIITLASPTLTDGYVRFHTNGFEDRDNYILPYRGNARIAAYKGDKIVWSWHIWITDRPLEQIYNNGYVTMDRNLGAVSASPEHYSDAANTLTGLVYQWGRKDPMFRYLIWNDPDRFIQNKAVSIEEAHSTPRVYYYNDDTDNWTTNISENLWGYVSDREATHKTMYDPCPPGYKVPVRSLLEINHGISEITESPGKGIIVTTPTEEIYYPKSLMIAKGGMLRDNDELDAHPDDQILNKDYCFLYSSSPQGGVGYARHFRFNYDDFKAAYEAGTSYESETSSMELGGGKVNAYPIRCVKENSGIAATDLSRYQTANSYILKNRGYYTFNATVKGNGVSGTNNVGTGAYTAFDAGMGSSLKDVAYVDILWWQGDLTAGSTFRTFAAGNHNDEEISDMCPVAMVNGGVPDTKGRVMIYVHDNTPANVGLAAYDRNRKLLWSWHIWINPDLDVVKFGECGIINAQLGATYIPSSAGDVTEDNFAATIGFYYQWGRKDPVFQNNQPYLVKSKDGSWSLHNSPQTVNADMIPQTVEDPLRFYTSSSNYWQTTYTSAGSPVESLWGYTGSRSGAGDSFAKTMWDPCPPGYKLIDHTNYSQAGLCVKNNAPAGQSETSTLSGAASSSFGLFATPDVKSSYIYNSTINVDPSGIWFPFAGYINQTGSFTDFKKLNYTTCSCPFGYESYRHFSISTTTATNIHDKAISQARAMSARCLKE